MSDNWKPSGRSLIPGHCYHAPMCIGRGEPDETDPMGCYRCGEREMRNAMAPATQPQKAPPVAHVGSWDANGSDPVVAEGGARTSQGGGSPAIQGVVSPLTNSEPIDPDSPEAHRIARAALNECDSDPCDLQDPDADFRRPGYSADVLLDPTPPVIIPPYDPDPPRKAPAIDGFVWCHDCDQAVSAVAHDCPEARATR